MKRFIFGFQRRVWCPKWTPDSSISFMVTTAMAVVLLSSCARGSAPSAASVVAVDRGRPPPWCPDGRGQWPIHRANRRGGPRLAVYPHHRREDAGGHAKSARRIELPCQ